MTEEDFAAWRMHPVTKEVMAVLGARREARRQEWEGGSYTALTKDETILVNVGNMGECKGLAFVMDLDYEQLRQELNDAK